MKWLFFLAVVLGSTVASACPPGPCLKYRHMQPPPVPVPVINTYVRTVRAEPPRFSVRAVTAFLTGSTWEAFHPLNALVAVPHLRFVAPDHAIRSTPIERVVLVREIRQDEDLAVVSIDGEEFALYRCLDSAHHTTACLTRYVATE
jgi:hypothetical protein